MRLAEAVRLRRSHRIPLFAPDRLLSGIVLTEGGIAGRGFATPRNPVVLASLNFSGVVQLAA